ncbi:MAG: DUF4325 domain-containing protein [Erysipelotrichaceae bacterium]|nr:DUF4325 domain-containing protein [Erysipelotrichaceae bacterium]
MKIVIARDFTDTVGGRYIKEGDYSGELFREEILGPKLKQALASKDNLLIDFDGGYGYPTSFLEESFGGLVRDGFDKKAILNTLLFKSEDNLKIVERVKNYIMDAKENEK